MARRLVLLSIVIVTALAVTVRAQPIDVSGHRQLFLDDGAIESIHNLKRVVNQPAKYEGNPILRGASRPWQTFRVQLYGTAMYDAEAGLFKLWYLAGARFPGREPVTVDGLLRVPNFQSVGYATSKDGLNFDMPELGLVEFNGSKANNLCRIARECVEGIAVVHAPHDPDPNRRYKAFYWEHFVRQGNAPVTHVNGMSVSFSADGLSWTNHPDNPVIKIGSDTGQQALWDPKLARYVAYGRFGAGGRRVARSESEDFIHWSPPRLVFAADGRDKKGTEIYGMGIGLYEGLYLGMPWMYHAGSTHKIDVQLAVSRDGVKWHRVGDRQIFIPNGPEESWDAGLIFTACNPAVLVGDTIYIYYSACQHDHNYSLPLDQRTQAWWESASTSIGVATLRRDGFVSLDADDDDGWVLTKPFVMPDGALHLNVDATGGEARVVIAGKASKPIKGDQLDATVQFDGGNDVKLAGQTVQLRIHLRNAKLYSFWFDVEPKGS